MNFCLWLTGLPGSGKTTIRKELERLLKGKGLEPVVLSMDELRKFLTPTPKYTEEEREIVYRAMVLIATYVFEHSNRAIVIDATANRRRFRELARQRIPEFAEVYIRCPLEICKSRESDRKFSPVEKQLYQKADKGKLKGGLPGATIPYEEPLNPEILVPSDLLSPKQAALKIMNHIESKWIPGPGS
jgi:adenylylsulfate kinase